MGAPWNRACGKARWSTLAAVFFAMLAAGIATSATAAYPRSGTGAEASGAEANAAERSVLTLLNRERTKRGLAPLRRSGTLDAAASWQSRDMVSHRYFEHRRRGGPGLVRRIRRTGYLNRARRWIVGENIAWGEGGQASPAAIVAGWMASSHHRGNILYRRFRNIGIGLTPGDPAGAGGGRAVTVTTDFGFRSR
jgi:uncharacterized protein YkwD